jgi:fatty acid desaturase
MNDNKSLAEVSLERSRWLAKRRKRRHLRTVFLAVFAAMTFVWAAINVWDVDAEVMFEFFTMSVLLVGVVMLMAVILVVAKKLLHRLFER